MYIMQVHRRSGLKIHVSQRKLGILGCLALPGEYSFIVIQSIAIEAASREAGSHFCGFGNSALLTVSGLSSVCIRAMYSCTNGFNLTNSCGAMLPGDLESIFTLDASETPVTVVDWGFLGDTFPFFRPNFRNCEQHRLSSGADEVLDLHFSSSCEA